MLSLVYVVSCRVFLTEVVVYIFFLNDLIVVLKEQRRKGESTERGVA